MRHEIEFLVDEREAGILCVFRVRDSRLIAPERDGSLVGRYDAGQAPDQGRLAGAVGAHQPVHLSAVDVQVYRGEGARAAELLAQAADFEPCAMIILHVRELLGEL
jgi:hypothetical protein